MQSVLRTGQRTLNGPEERSRGSRVTRKGGTEEPEANRVRDVEAETVGGDSERADRTAEGVHTPELAGSVGEAHVKAGAPVEAGGESITEEGQPAEVSV